MNKHKPVYIALFCILLITSCNNNLDKGNNNKPNFLIILVDDLGFSDLSCYGSEIKTPSLDKLADQGMLFTDFYVSSLCAPTRAMLLTGVDNHQNGLGTMPPGHTENQYLKPGYEGVLNNRVVTLSEVLHKNGYHTFMSGKWHLGHHKESYPFNRGFERSFAFLGGGSGHFNNAFPLGPGEEPVSFYVRDNKKINELPDNFFSSKNFTDEMIHYILEQEDDAPFFGYLAYTAPHDPLHVPDIDLDNYRDVYNSGYEQIKRNRLLQMKKMKLVAESTPYNPGTGKFPQWNDLSKDEKKLQARKMELYAAMIENLDYHIGRLFDTLKKVGKYDNTVFVFLSDNGANPKEAIFYPGNSKEFLEDTFNNTYENLGKSNSFVSQGGAWAEVSNTPFTYFKTTTGEGGIHAPLIIAGPGINPNKQYSTITGMHVCDIFPTILDIANVSHFNTFNGIELAPLYGISAKKFLIGKEELVRNTANSPLHFEMMECKAIIKGKWKAMMLQPPYLDVPKWQLFDLSVDPLEKKDLALQNPKKLNELIIDWNNYANDVGYIKAEGEMLINNIGPKAFYNYEPIAK